MTQERPRNETFSMSGQSVEKVVEKVKALISEGNVRNVTIRSATGTTIASFPLTAGVIGLAVAPVLAAVAAIAAIVTDCQITLERRE